MSARCISRFLLFRAGVASDGLWNVRNGNKNALLASSMAKLFPVKLGTGLIGIGGIGSKVTTIDYTARIR